ncbi:MAG TPA: hypothetical protein VFR09_02825 [Alphaproteobacteria bacterium]|nr:hypothetical protein [Alphaproteobacteria bacterium]
MSFFPSKPIEIKLVGPNLVAAFHRAHPALVWRFDLERNHSFTLALQGDEGDWELGITSPKGEFYPFVHFSNREDAEEALAAVHKVLMSYRRPKTWLIVKIIAIAVVAFVLCWGAWDLYVHMLTSRIMASQSSTPIQQQPTPLPSIPPAAPLQAPPAADPEDVPSGIPLPADEVLKPPR